MYKYLTVITCLLLFVLWSNPVLAQDTLNSDELRIIVFGAHPDDCELKVGGMATKWAAAGHKVKFVSTTNGDIGHAKMAGGPLAIRRAAEVQAAAKVLGIESQVLDNHDGELMPTLENRKTCVRLIREWKADVVIGPRTNDYHPDHRYTGILMQDAAYMVMVPYFCPDVPALSQNPVFMYVSDGFQKPNPFEPDIVVGIDDVVDTKVQALWHFESQIESWWMTRGFETIRPIPKNGQARNEYFELFENRMKNRDSDVAQKFKQKMIEIYGPKANDVKYAEAFELCEYGKKASPQELMKIFMIN